MSRPVICAREGCHHRLRMHAQGVDGANDCLTPECGCWDFLEEVDVLMAQLRATEMREHPLQMAYLSTAVEVDVPGESYSAEIYRRLRDSDPTWNALVAAGAIVPGRIEPNCRHRGGEEDCPDSCVLLFGDRYWTERIGPNPRTPEPTEEALMNPWSNRHPSVKHFAPFFAYSHLPEHLQVLSRPFGEMAHLLLSKLHNGPELSAALRKLVEAKDCAVRQGVLDKEADRV